jgi:hypothetical protein
MPAFITRKKFFLILGAALCAVLGAGFLLTCLFEGPRLGFYYDFLRSRRPAPPLAREILLIDTGEMVEPLSVVSVLNAMIEMDATALIIETPVLGFSSIKTGDIEEIRYRFDEEFSLLGRNIRNLFEAIRLGSIPPAESARYVGELIELTERGKERLSSALVRQDEGGSERLEKIQAAAGNVFKAGDLHNRPWLDSPWYSKPIPDKDGIVRRLFPVLSEREGANEQVIYAGLKGRWRESLLEYGEYGPVLVNRTGEGETRFPMDRNGGILMEKYGKNSAFRRIPLSLFADYEETDRALLRLLKEAEAQGIYSEVLPERMPGILCEYAQALREDFLETPEPENRRAWIEARKDYLKSLDDFLYGPSEMTLVSGYEELIASGELGEQGIARITALRDELIRCFVNLRFSYQELMELRNLLAEALEASFCIMGAPGEDGLNPADAEVSAILANTLLTGSFIRPGEDRYILFWTFFFSLPALLALTRFRFLPGLVMTLVFSTVIAAGFSWYFILSAYWIDPVIPSLTAFTGMGMYILLSFIVNQRGAGHFRLAYGPHVSKPGLKQLIRSGRPRIDERITAAAAVIAVKNPALLAREDRGDLARGNAEARAYRERISAIFKKSGAAVLGGEGDTVYACFGSPLEQVYQNGGHPAAKAGSFIAELLKEKSPANDWYFGIAYGECCFFWEAGRGYTAFGRPMVRSRLLAGLNKRFGTHALISDPVREHLTLPVRRLQSLGEKEGGREAFYEIII